MNSLGEKHGCLLAEGQGLEIMAIPLGGTESNPGKDREGKPVEKALRKTMASQAVEKIVVNLSLGKTDPNGKFKLS